MRLTKRLETVGARTNPRTVNPTTQHKEHLMYRFFSWMAIGIAAAFLVVATAAFSPSATMWLAFAIALGTLIVSGSISFSYRGHIPTVLTGLATALVSAWTLVASVVFSEATVQNLALASGLALAGLAITGITEHELDTERALTHSAAEDGKQRSALAPAA
jgi:FtsH-binding integral membrane protein